jgi:4-carboxymuconolactone decarboxylase
MVEVSPFEVFADAFPEVTAAYRSMKTSGEGSLDEKTRHLIQLAIMVSIGSKGGTCDHVREALDSGASPDQVRQAILLVLGPTGMSRTGRGLAWADEVIETRSAARG